MLQNINKADYQYKHINFLSMLYCSLLIISVLLPYKIIDFFGLPEPGGIFIFPLTYLLGGAIAEVYGRKQALKIVYSGLICLFIFNILLSIIVRVPSVSYAQNQEIYLQAFGSSIRLSIGCGLGLFFSDLTNVYRITKLKLIFNGKYFFQRCLVTTFIAESIFNIITYAVTYYGVVSMHDYFRLVLCSLLLKMIYSIIMIIPMLYLMRFLKASEGIDIYDAENSKEESKFTPDVLFVKFLSLQNK